jgi:hypothetical protein
MKKIKVAFGKDGGIHEFEFKTEGERDAFLLGLSEGHGWDTYEFLVPEDATPEYYTQWTGEQEEAVQ